MTTLGRTELHVSRLGFGGAPIGLLDSEQEQVRHVIDKLLEGGVNLIDTAAAYKGSEEALGKALDGRRDDVVLVSKCGQSFDDVEGEAWSRAAILGAIDRSLKRLKTDHLDVVLLHTCDLDVLKKGEALAAVVEARDAGKTRFIGYSGDNDAAVWAAGRDEVDVIEMSINIADQANIDTVLPVCRERDVGVLAKRPIANAAWKGASQQRGMYADYAKPYEKRLAAMGVTPGDLGYSGHPEVEWPEIALKFTLAIQGVHTAIVGTTNEANAWANVQAVGGSPLREQAVQRLRDAFRKARAEGEAGESWEGLT